MIFQENLRHYRETAGFSSARAFAKHIGVPYTTYITYENKDREPKYDLLCKIAAALGVTTDELLGYSLDEYQHYKTIAEKAGLLVNEYPPDTPGHDVIEVCDPAESGSQVLAGYLSKKDYISTAQRAYNDHEKNSIPVLLVSLKSAFINDFFGGYAERRTEEISRTTDKPATPKE